MLSPKTRLISCTIDLPFSGMSPWSSRFRVRGRRGDRLPPPVVISATSIVRGDAPRSQRLGQRLDRQPGVGLDRHVRFPVAAQLERVDVDLDQLRVVRKGRNPPWNSSMREPTVISRSAAS